MDKIIIKERIGFMKKLSAFPRPVWGCIHALRQGHLDEFLPFLKADILFWFSCQIPEWWKNV